MGRQPIRADLKRRPHTFSLDERQVAFIDQYAEANELSRSQSLRALIAIAEEEMPVAVKREIARKRMEKAKAARVVPRVEEPKARICPSCGDKDGFVLLPHDRWRCDFCMARGEL